MQFISRLGQVASDDQDSLHSTYGTELEWMEVSLQPLKPGNKAEKPRGHVWPCVGGKEHVRLLLAPLLKFLEQINSPRVGLFVFWHGGWWWWCIFSKALKETRGDVSNNSDQVNIYRAIILGLLSRPNTCGSNCVNFQVGIVWPQRSCIFGPISPEMKT